MLSTKQLKCIELMLTMPEYTQRELAEQLGVNENTIGNWKKNEEFMTEKQKASDELWRDMADKAQKRMFQLMDSANESVALGATKYVMDSAGRNAVIKVDASIKDVVIGLSDD